MLIRKKSVKRRKQKERHRKTERQEEKQKEKQGRTNKGPKKVRFHSIFEKSRVCAGFFKSSI